MKFKNRLARVACVFVCACAAASAQPVPVVDRGLLPGDAGVGPATDSQVESSIAKGGNQFLVAWTDFRGRSAASQSIQGDADIFGIRLDSAGNPVDPAPFLIAGGMGLQQRPRVAWNGENWLVVYESQDPTAFYYDTFIRAARVSPLGQVLDSTPVQLPLDQYSPNTVGLTVAGQNGQWVIARCVYHSDAYGTYLAGQRIAGDGHLVDTIPVMLNDWVYGQLVLIANNGEYLAVGPDWNGLSAVKARRIGLNLQPLAASFSLPPVMQSIAGNGTGEYYVTWVANYTDFVGSRMTSAGTLLNPAGTLLPGITGGDIAAMHDGTNWWISWTLNSARTMRISSTGTVLDPGGILLPIVATGSVNYLYGSRLAPRTGGGAIYTWYDYRAALGTESNVFALPISAANSAGTERFVSTSTANQRSSKLCPGPGGSAAVVFVSEFANDDRVLVHLLNSSGSPINPQPIEVHRGASVGRCGIAFNGSLYLVAFDTATGIKARRMSPNGTFVDAAPFDVLVGFNCDVGALGGNFLVTGARALTFETVSLFGERVDGSTGALLDAAPIFLGGGFVREQARVRSDGTNWLVASDSNWTHDSSQGDVFWTIVPPTGAPVAGPTPVQFSGGSGDLDVAFSGSKYLFVWRSNSLSNANNYVAGRIMNADRSFISPAFVISDATGRQLRPTVAWDGSNFVVAWDDQRNQGSFFDARTDVYATRISEGGVLLDPDGFPVVAGAQGECGPSLLSIGGITLASSTRYVVTPPFDSYRVGVSTLGAPACVADVDNGTMTGTPDGGVTIDDLLYYLFIFDQGLIAADVDNGSGTGTRDGGVTIDDLLYYLLRFTDGC